MIHDAVDRTFYDAIKFYLLDLNKLPMLPEDNVLQQILSAQAKEGMVLAKDVMTPEGRVLCGKGTSLTASLLDRLEKMDITHVTVEGHPIKVAGEKSLKEELHDVEERFVNVTKIPPLMYLKKRIMTKLAELRGK